MADIKIAGRIKAGTADNIAGYASEILFDDEASNKTVKEKLEGKQDTLTFDNVPTKNSNNPVKSGGVYQAIQSIDVSGQISGKADKSEMSVVAGTGANADKTTITLKSGTSATVLTQHQDVSEFLREGEVFGSGGDSAASFNSYADTVWNKQQTLSESQKQQVRENIGIADLETIRNGAAAGVTAIQSVTVGTTTTGAAGSSASVVNSGTATAPVLDFTIPQGAQGVKGDTVIMGNEDTYTLYNTTGDAVDGAMTQQAVTRELAELEGEIYTWNIVSPSATASGWALTGVNGLCVSNSSASLVKYQVTAGTKMWLKLSKDNGGVYQWQNNASVGSQSNQYLIGSPVTTATDGEVTVPTGATYLIVSQNNSNTTNEVSVYGGSQIQTNKEDIAALNEQIVTLTDLNTSDLWSQGYYGVDNGSSHSTEYYIKSSNLPTDVENIEAINTFWYYLQAWEGSTFKGTWNGSAFSTSSYLKQTSTDLDAIRTSYPSYSFRLSVRNEDYTSINPSTDYVNIKLYRNDYLIEKMSAVEESVNSLESSIELLSNLTSISDYTLIDTHTFTGAGTTFVGYNVTDTSTYPRMKVHLSSTSWSYTSNTSNRFSIQLWNNGVEGEYITVNDGINPNIKSDYEFDPNGNDTVRIGMRGDTGVTLTVTVYAATAAPIDIDERPTEGSFNLVRSGGIYDAISSMSGNTGSGTKTEELYIGELAVGSHNQYGFITGYSTRVCMKNVIMFPRRRVKYKVSINPAYQASFEFGIYASDMTHGLGSWLSDGDEFTLPENYNLYIVSFKKVNGNTISASEIPSINPHFYAVDYEPYDIRECVSESENVFQNAMYDYGNHGYSYGLDDNGSDFVAIAHATDIHSDRQRLKDCYDIVMKEKNITAMCITGDTNNDVIQNGFGWLHELVNDYHEKGVDSAFCFGNHEVYSRTSVSISNSDAYNMVMQPMATAIGNTGTDCYYYRDFSTKKLRIISLNLYEDYGATGITRQYPHWSQAQVDWFISTLLSTPANYGVVILMHAAFVRPQKVEGKGDFYQDVVSTSTPTEYSDNPIYEIVDAFISRTTLSKSYSQDGTPSTLSVSADFTSVNSGVEFIAYLCGHTHSELVGYAKGQTNTQLVLMSPCLASDYFHGNVQFWQANSSDVARNPNNVSGTVMNVYVIDRIHKTVRIVRFGNTWTYDMKRRLYMEIPYAT